MIYWLQENWTRLIIKILEHLSISLIALAIGILIAVPAGILLTRSKRLSKIVLGLVSVMQTLPSLALLAIMVPFFGVGKLPAIIALVIYSLLPILRNTYLGMMAVDEKLIDVSKGMGMTRRQVMRKIRIPLAIPVIMSGIRLSAVYLVSWTTIASYIGAGGLGDFIFMGLNNFNFTVILAGAIPVTLLAILFGYSLGKLEKIVEPKTRREAGANYA